jgi:hypothetical protein
MSQIPPSMPPDPNRPQPLQYHDPTPRGYAIPTVWQALLGTIGTAVVVVGGGFLIALAAGFLVSMMGGDSAFFIVCGVLSLVGLGGLLLLARRLRRSDLYRGWAIGIYIGLGLGALFWGTCALMIAAMVSGH